MHKTESRKPGVRVAKLIFDKSMPGSLNSLSMNPFSSASLPVSNFPAPFNQIGRIEGHPDLVSARYPFVFVNYIQKLPPLYDSPATFVDGFFKSISAALNEIVSNRSPASFPLNSPECNTNNSSFIDPISHSPILCPGRGVSCNHMQCFDLHEFLLLNSNVDNWKCPICGSILTYEDLRFDCNFFTNCMKKHQSNSQQNSFNPSTQNFPNSQFMNDSISYNDSIQDDFSFFEY